MVVLELHSRGGTRTPDPVINSHLLYHLSYSGMVSKGIGAKGSNQPLAIGFPGKQALVFYALNTVG
jgi:hypothetical protein